MFKEISTFFVTGHCAEFLLGKSFHHFVTGHIVTEVWMQSGVFGEIVDTVLD
jgi:hypothetical protein